MKNIWRIIRISKPLYPVLFTVCFLILIGAVTELIGPFISKLIVDQIVLKVQGRGGDLGYLAQLIGYTFAVGMAGVVAGAFSDRLGDHFAGGLRQFLTEKFYAKILTLPQEYFDNQISGKITNQLRRGIVTIQGFMNTSTNFILPTILQSILTIAYISYYSKPVGFFVFLLFPVYLGISYWSTKKWGKIEVVKNKIEDQAGGRIQEVIGNMKLVKSFTSEGREYEVISKNMTDINKLYAMQSTSFHLFDFARNTSLIIIFTLASVFIFNDTFSGRLSIGEMVLILQLLNQSRRPLFAMSFILTQVQTAESGSKEFFEILQLPSTEPFTFNRAIEKIKDPTIELKKVFFKYETSETILKDVSYFIKAHEKVALVGHSGVGKSTMVNLILKFYRPTKGHVLLGGKDYSDLSHEFIRDNIALVFQEQELFSSTVAENVAYGLPGAGEKEVIEALKKANAWDFVKKLPEGIKSQVGERGVRLSGGQKQRIQIARAILKNAPILILDEATSSLDSQSEQEVQQGLETLMHNRLVIIIAHRFSTIQNVDRIFVIDEGTIVDQGTPKELSVRPGIYRDLLEYQVSGNKKLLAQFDIY
jgi:ATP-binding cassette, subfamily B, bacterial